jgi:molybdopterin synthase catalytic subunit
MHGETDGVFITEPFHWRAQVTFVGQIRSINQTSTNIKYKIEDGTGSIEATVWVDEAQDTEDVVARRAACGCVGCLGDGR